jgi:hypothetical protein
MVTKLAMAGLDPDKNKALFNTWFCSTGAGKVSDSKAPEV